MENDLEISRLLGGVRLKKSVVRRIVAEAIDGRSLRATGRTEQLNFKATKETRDMIAEAARMLDIPKSVLLEKIIHDRCAGLISERALKDNEETYLDDTWRKRDDIDRLISCTFKIHPDVYKKISAIKAERRTSLQRIFEHALDLWLSERGAP